MFDATLKQKKWWLKYSRSRREHFNEMIGYWEQINPDVSFLKVRPWYDPGCIKEMIMYKAVKGAIQTGVGSFLLTGVAISSVPLYSDVPLDASLKLGFAVGTFMGCLGAIAGACIYPLGDLLDWTHDIMKYLPRIQIKERLEYTQGYIDRYFSYRPTSHQFSR